MSNCRVILMLFFTSTYSFHVLGNSIEVCKSCQFTTIKQALGHANAHDTIRVYKGIYEEYNLEVNKPMVMLGINVPTIDGKEQGTIINITADSVVIDGFQIENVGLSYTKDYAAIHVYKSRHFNIKNNILKKVFFGLLIEKSHDGQVRNNEVSSDAKEEFNSGNGIHLWHCSNIEVTGNTLFRLRDGIYFEFVSESTISHNVSYNNVRYGLHFMFSNNDNYYDNEFHDNGAGVAVMFSKFINMKRNKFYQNWGTASFGLLLQEIYDAEIENNIFEENTIGIHIEGSTRINYVHNQFNQNGWAVKFAGGCYANVFYQNNFISNSFDVSYNSKLNDNRFEENYWSSYTGYDLNKDDIGDVPYRPVKLFSYVVNRTPESIVLLRSLFIDILNFSEKVSPVFTPDNLIDDSPKMKAFND